MAVGTSCLEAPSVHMPGCLQRHTAPEDTNRCRDAPTPSVHSGHRVDDDELE
jgi:hypothetical protein